MIKKVEEIRRCPTCRIGYNSPCEDCGCHWVYRDGIIEGEQERTVSKITWLDAREIEATPELKSVMENLESGNELLVVKETYGEILDLEDVYLVTTEKDNTGHETITVIPKSWMVEIE